MLLQLRYHIGLLATCVLESLLHCGQLFLNVVVVTDWCGPAWLGEHGLPWLHCQGECCSVCWAASHTGPGARACAVCLCHHSGLEQDRGSGHVQDRHWTTGPGRAAGCSSVSQTAQILNPAKQGSPRNIFKGSGLKGGKQLKKSVCIILFVYMQCPVRTGWCKFLFLKYVLVKFVDPAWPYCQAASCSVDWRAHSGFCGLSTAVRHHSASRIKMSALITKAANNHPVFPLMVTEEQTRSLNPCCSICHSNHLYQQTLVIFQCRTLAFSTVCLHSCILLISTAVKQLTQKSKKNLSTSVGC